MDKLNIRQNRFAELAKLGETMFHTGDLANLWRIRNPNTLYTTLSRYVNQGLLYRIYKGLYSLISPAKLDPLLIGIKAIHGHAYISVESVLFREGVLHQKNYYITLIGAKSAKFKILGRHYYSRQLADIYLFNPEGVVKEGPIPTATVSRAVADMLYFNPEFRPDNPAAIDWNKVREIQMAVGYPLFKNRVRI